MTMMVGIFTYLEFTPSQTQIKGARYGKGKSYLSA